MANYNRESAGPALQCIHTPQRNHAQNLLSSLLELKHEYHNHGCGLAATMKPCWILSCNGVADVVSSLTPSLSGEAGHA